ncbi:MAG TPA: hydrogenase maturation nickel metallochaperone HypA [Thermoplasmata archaeon]|nr:hydrogenase maturation nickel metallochaperone HypA [Thermoplasmata archaeon]
MVDSMHEYSVMTQVVKVADMEARRHGAKKVYSITLEIGELTLLLKPQLEFAFEVLREGTLLENADIIFKDVKARVRCPQCGREYTMKDLDLKEGSSYYAHFVPLVCPECHKKMDVVKGKEFTIKEMKMEI